MLVSSLDVIANDCSSTMEQLVTDLVFSPTLFVCRIPIIFYGKMRSGWNNNSTLLLPWMDVRLDSLCFM